MSQTHGPSLRDHPHSAFETVFGGTSEVPHTKKEAFPASHTTLRTLGVFAGFLQISFAKGKMVPSMECEKQLSHRKTGAQRKSGVSQCHSHTGKSVRPGLGWVPHHS